MSRASSKFMQRQRDFSAGEIFSGAKRRDDLPFIHAGGRQMSNWRIESIGTLVPRPARRALFASSGARSEYLRMSPSDEFEIVFGNGNVTFFNLFGSQIATNTSGAYLWVNATVDQIAWTQLGNDITIAFPGMRPQICRFNSSLKTWSFLPFAFRLSGSTTYEPFFRASVLGETMTPSGTSGAITLACSADYFTAPMAGAKLSLLGQQVTINAVTGPRLASATVVYQLAAAINIVVADATAFQAGQVCSAKNNGTKIEVSAVDYAGKSVTGTLMGQLTLPALSWASEVLISPLGSSAVSGTPTTVANGGTVQWLEEFMGASVGWPQSCFSDKQRLGFCDFPQRPEAILWSSTNQPDVFWIDSAAAATSPGAGADATSAILEFIPAKPRVRHVVGWGDEFVFTDRGIFQIPISGQNPLKPGSVEFRQISSDGAAPVRPVPTLDSILYINAGQNRVSMVLATGSYTRPYVSEDLTDAHQHLFTGPRMLAVSNGDGAHPERYVYVVNVDGTLVVGKFGADRKLAGWLPHKSIAALSWVTAAGARVYFTSLYPNAVLWVSEAEDDTTWLDGYVAQNSIPPGMSVAGRGPLWWLSGQTVALMDGTLDLGDRQVDANGNLVLNNGDNLTSPTLYVGAAFQSVFEPFVPHLPPGQSQKQSQRPRSISRATAAVQQSNGFTLGKRTIATVNFGEDASVAPVLREGFYSVRPLGGNVDPRIRLVRSRPGPFRLLEFSMEVTS